MTSRRSQSIMATPPRSTSHVALPKSSPQGSGGIVYDSEEQRSESNRQQPASENGSRQAVSRAILPVISSP
jgi:hypothetical protein